MTSSNRNALRMVCVTLAAALLGGCTALGESDVGSIIALARGAWSGNNDITLQEAAAVPYASVGVRLGDSAQIMLVLASEASGRMLWTSSARLAITTENGRIMRTAGFGHNLGGHTAVASTRTGVVRWQADFPDLRLFSVLITCEDRDAGPETISILGKDIHTRRIDESCRSDDSLDWSFRNV
ncbi:MAG: YjbF family lipoprotein, partial [Alphaproteobacteria bacterium]|nr:YjbF family lipoprotein [Alphaproteobacteria bacterium]